MSSYEEGVKLIRASFDPEFVTRLRTRVANPDVHENGMVSESCGSSLYDSNYTIFHDPQSVSQPDEQGFQRGGLETSPEGINQFCQPKKNSARILWHTHPRGTPAYPSGSDIFVVVVRDCSGKRGEDASAQSLIEFLFTEHGFWIIHRRVGGDNRIFPGMDMQGSGKRARMRDIDNKISSLEDEIIRPCYMRSRVPTKNSAGDIHRGCVDILGDNRVHVSFHTWDEASAFDIPHALFEPVVTDVCPAV
jgi:hypothetical protein